MAKIIRTKTKAHGGITEREKALMAEHSALWIKRAFRTDPIEPDKIIPAIEGLYASAGLKKPRVVIVPSPLVMAFAYGAAAAILQKNDVASDEATSMATRRATTDATALAISIATYEANYKATAHTTTHNEPNDVIYRTTRAAIRMANYEAIDSATHAATSTATNNVTFGATNVATNAATIDAIDMATADLEELAASVCRDLAGDLGIEYAKQWRYAGQGGNMWAGYDCYLTACRDILGLDLPEHAAYSHWEQATIHGGFRVMHRDFCLVCDFPEVIKIDENNRPHCEDGPSHRWRDGWSLYHWHGVSVPSHWIEDRKNLSPNEVLQAKNVEQRAAGISIIGMAKMLDHLPHKIIDSDPDPLKGDLIEITLDGLPETELYLKFECPRNGHMMEAINKRMLAKRDLHHAHAWHANVPARLFSFPQMRT